MAHNLGLYAIAHISLISISYQSPKKQKERIRFRLSQYIKKELGRGGSTDCKSALAGEGFKTCRL
jgi:hypothetical protein